MRPPTYLSLSLAFLSCASIAFSQCTLTVPQNPLTAQGLATPYELTGCNQLDFADFGVFVEAAIIDPATGQIQIYNPLVINAGMTAVGANTNTSTSASTGMSTSMSTSTSTSTSTSSSSSSSGSKSSSSTSTTTSSSGSVKTTNTGTIISTTSSSTMPSSSVSVKTNNGNASTIASTHTASVTMTPVARAAATQGAGFFIPPIVPTLPANAVVGLWFGSNAQTVTLTGDTATCVNGLGTSVFGQFAYCNAPAWFSAANTAVQNGMTKVLAPGTGTSGQACPTIRDFRIVDQDQSDNVVTTYLLIGGNTLAQNTPANSQANPDAEVLSNASDNALINEFIQPSLGCTPYSNPCTTCSKGESPALATNELQASYFPPAGGPAMVPLNDPMVLVNGQQSLQKVNLYRSGVNQAQADNANASGTTYCQQFAQSGIFISLNQQLFSGTTSPAVGEATNLFTFLAMRSSMSFGPAPGLGCTQLLNVNNPITLTTDGNGVVTAATINTQELQQILGGLTTTGTATTTSATQSGVRLVSTASGVSTATSPTITASNTTSITSSSVHSASTSSSAVTTTPVSKTTSATQSSVRLVSTASGMTTTSPAATNTTSVTRSSVHSVSTSVTVTASPTTSVTPSSVHSVSTTSATATSPAISTTSVTPSSVHSVSTTSATATSPAMSTTSVTHSSVISVSTPSRTASTTSATTTSQGQSTLATTSVAVTVTSPASTSNGICTSTVTVTATVCPSQTSPPSYQHFGQGGHYWLRGLPAREHSRMQKKNRHSSDW